MLKLRTGVVAAVVASFTIAACGGGQDATTASSAVEAGNGQEAAPQPSKPAEISVGSPISLAVLVSEEGRTLYVFGKDPQGGKPTCYGACAEAWPPLLTVGQPRPFSEAATDPALLGTVAREDGSTQVTYDGHPLYEYAEDEIAAAKGFATKAFGGSWYLITPKGTVVKRPKVHF